jgi:UDP-N-acetylglucosamine:LPS N-acetylglucosamine transferase
VRIVSELVVTAWSDVGATEPVMLVGNADVLELVRGANGFVRVLPTDHATVLRTLNVAAACLSAPGLTTMFECGAYGAPLILVPEQHYAHLANFEAVTSCGGPETFPHALLNSSIETRETDLLTETQAVLADLEECYDERGARWASLVSAVASGMEAVRRDRAAVHASQDAAVRAFVGGYRGTAQVADELDVMLEGASRTRALS